jgi:glucan phosphoethanolaminetransferase (alkaline phosphatase superfamily)
LNKEKTLLRFFAVIILFSALLGFVMHLGFDRLSITQKPTSNVIMSLLLFFIFTTSLVYTMVSASTRQRPQKMITYFMGATTIKLLLSLLIIAVYAMTQRETAKGFIVLFVIGRHFYPSEIPRKSKLRLF